jgi:hypothetical protein
VNELVEIENTGLTAALTALPPGTNDLINQQQRLQVTANATNVARIELFSTGGSQGAVSNQATALFTVSAAQLGLGLHPFYAMVTDGTGHVYRTAQVTGIFPLLELTLAGTPPMLKWPTALDHQYNVLFTTNLTAGFEVAGTLTATNNGTLALPVPLTGPAGYYQVQVAQ